MKEYTFLDYIMGGCQINFTVSFSFSVQRYLLRSSTGSDVCCLFTRWPSTSQGPTGIPDLLSLCTTSVLRASMSTCPLSGLLAMSSRTTTGVYEKGNAWTDDKTWARWFAFKVEVLLSPPCSDKMFPAFGFGAQIPPSWQVRLHKRFITQNSL